MILENPSHSHTFLGKTKKCVNRDMHLVDNLQTCKTNPKNPKKRRILQFDSYAIYRIDKFMSCNLWYMSFITHDMWIDKRKDSAWHTHAKTSKLFFKLKNISVVFESKLLFTPVPVLSSSRQAAWTTNMLSISSFQLTFTSTNSVWFRMVLFYHTDEKHSIQWTLQTCLLVCLSSWMYKVFNYIFNF